ncbi:MAG: hypothetical protein NUV34_08300 [Sulfuricaulis sp.]|nr:hypothetical protein [Sulfuricaulis sp.]
MNYELGMHCTGFEFSYCCVLPPYNSILAQVVKTQQSPLFGTAFPRLLEADPNVGLDFLGRPTVLRDTEMNWKGEFKKYVLRYWHDAQPRKRGEGGARQTSTLISHVEGNSLLMWNTQFDAATTDSNNALIYGNYGSTVAAVPPPAPNPHQASSPKNHVLQGNGSYADPEDNYANAWLNHLYIYADLEGSNPSNTSLEKNKIRLGLRNQNASTVFSTVLPQNSGPAFHPMGPGSTPGLNNVLTFSGDTGTVVYTQMKVLENLPVMLTSPRIWEALGLPLDPFEDTINFFGDPGKITEETIRPYVRMNAALHNYDPTKPGGIGTAVLQDWKPVVGFGTAPIDIPNCERCHALGADVASSSNPHYPANSTDIYRPAAAAKVALEIDFWNSYYAIGPGDSDWYSKLKGAAISILAIHDNQHRTDFTLNYPVTGGGSPQLTRLGHESVLCQRCHADNVIAVVKSADTSRGLIPPLTEAIHNNHKNNEFSDSLGRNGGCQGCHPAHRSDGDLSNYPITHDGLNTFASSDNRDAAGGCFVGRDVHSNPNKDIDGAGTPEHLTAVGQWLSENVFEDPSPKGASGKGIWCTNCHSQFSQEIWKAENVPDLVHSNPGDPGNVRAPTVNATLADVAAAAGTNLTQAIAWIDPKTNDDTAAVWADDPGLCNYVGGLFGGPVNPAHDANVATIEVALNNGVHTCSTPVAAPGPDCDNDPEHKPDFFICGSTDGDGDFSVHILDFCTTGDCVTAAQGTLGNSAAVPVPFSAATDGRDHWLASGEPHCADCHKAPYTEQSGNINAFPPFNYPKKASLFRYSRGHQDITCQGCHESTHGLYPVTSDIDTTTYAQAASMNTDGSHGPLKCGACHVTNKYGVPSEAVNIKYKGVKIANNFDAAVSWAHSFTNEVNPAQGTEPAKADALCVNCHTDNYSKVSATEEEWLEHAVKGRVGRMNMDKVEIAKFGHVSGVADGVCTTCHSDKMSKVSCGNVVWKLHIPYGAVAQTVWESVSKNKTGSTCGF